MGCKLMELKSPILLYNKMYFIFWGTFKFGGLVRSHSPHGPKDAPGLVDDVPAATLRHLLAREIIFSLSVLEQ